VPIVSQDAALRHRCHYVDAVTVGDPGSAIYAILPDHGLGACRADAIGRGSTEIARERTAMQWATAAAE
jgi:hypothetical protein